MFTCCKRLFAGMALILALCTAAPAQQSRSVAGVPVINTPTATGQAIIVNQTTPTLQAEWENLAGGTTVIGTVPIVVTVAGTQYTVSLQTPLALIYGGNGTTAPVITVTAPIVITGSWGNYNISCPTCSTGGSYPTGTAPQIGGYDGSGNPEAETVTGAITFTRGGSHSYVAATPHTACAGQWINDISTGATGTCSSTVTAPITTPQTLTYSSSTATFNAAAGVHADIAISANVTITMSGCTAGQHLFLKLHYTGSFTPTFTAGGSDTLNYNTSGVPTWTATSGKYDIVGFTCDSNGSGIAYDALPASLGYSG